eukprot:COSAG01_NODE_3094_length_6607_cov_2.703419_5_plen_69_part_00
MQAARGGPRNNFIMGPTRVRLHMPMAAAAARGTVGPAALVRWLVPAQLVPRSRRALGDGRRVYMLECS